MTVTSPAAKVKRNNGPVTTIYAGSPVTIAGPDSTSVVLNRRVVKARAATSPPPTCLPQYTPSPSRITSACNCLSITSSTLLTISTAPATNTVSNALSTPSLQAPLSPQTSYRPPARPSLYVTAGPCTNPASQTTTTTITTTTTTSAPPPTSTCLRCNICTANTDCKPGFECDAYIGFSFGDVDLCTTVDIQSSSDICDAICS